MGMFNSIECNYPLPLDLTVIEGDEKNTKNGTR